MKKRSTYLLLILVIAVWGGIFFRLFSRTDSGPATPVLPPVKPDTPEAIAFSAPDTLVLDYPDPFLKHLMPSEPITTVADDFFMEDAELMEAMPADIDWTFITYAGMISNARRSVGLITINGREMMVREGQSVEGVRFVRIQQDQLLIEYNDQVQTIYQQPQQHNENEFLDPNENPDPIDDGEYGGV